MKKIFNGSVATYRCLPLSLSCYKNSFNGSQKLLCFYHHHYLCNDFFILLNTLVPNASQLQQTSNAFVVIIVLSVLDPRYNRVNFPKNYSLMDISLALPSFSFTITILKSYVILSSFLSSFLRNDFLISLNVLVPNASRLQPTSSAFIFITIFFSILDQSYNKVCSTDGNVFSSSLLLLCHHFSHPSIHLETISPKLYKQALD